MLVLSVENNLPQTKIWFGKVHFNFIVSFLFILSPFLAASNTVLLPAHLSSPSTVPGYVHTSARLKSPQFLVRRLKTSSILRAVPQIAVSFYSQLLFAGLLSAILPQDGCTSALSIPGTPNCHSLVCFLAAAPMLNVVQSSGQAGLPLERLLISLFVCPLRHCVSHMCVLSECINRGPIYAIKIRTVWIMVSAFSLQASIFLHPFCAGSWLRTAPALGKCPITVVWLQLSSTFILRQGPAKLPG